MLHKKNGIKKKIGALRTPIFNVDSLFFANLPEPIYCFVLNLSIAHIIQSVIANIQKIDYATTIVEAVNIWLVSPVNMLMNLQRTNNF